MSLTDFHLNIHFDFHKATMFNRPPGIYISLYYNNYLTFYSNN